MRGGPKLTLPVRTVPPPLPPLGRSPGPARTWPHHRASPVIFRKNSKKIPQKSDRVTINLRGKFNINASPISSFNHSFISSSSFNYISQSYNPYLILISYLIIFHLIISYRIHISVSHSFSSRILTQISQHRITTQRMYLNPHPHATHAPQTPKPPLTYPQISASAHTIINFGIKSLCHIIIFVFCCSVTYLGRNLVTHLTKAAITLSKNDNTGKRWHTKRSWQLVSGTGACTLRCCCHFPKPNLATLLTIHTKNRIAIGVEEVLALFHRYITSDMEGKTEMYSNGYIETSTTYLRISEHGKTLTNTDRDSELIVGSWCYALAGSLRVYFKSENCLLVVTLAFHYVGTTIMQPNGLYSNPLVTFRPHAPQNKQHAFRSTINKLHDLGKSLDTVLKSQTVLSSRSLSSGGSAAWLPGWGELVSGARGPSRNLWVWKSLLHATSRPTRLTLRTPVVEFGPRPLTIRGDGAGYRSTRLKAKTVVGQKAPWNDTHHYSRWAGGGVSHPKGPGTTCNISNYHKNPKKPITQNTQNKITQKTLTKLTITGRKAFIFISKPLLTPTVGVVNLQCEREEGGKVIRNYDPG